MAEYVYFNFFTIGALIPTIFMGVLGYFFITIKNKSTSTLYYTLFFITLTPFFLFYVFAAGIYHPLTAYHRWGTVSSCLPVLIFMGLAVINFPKARFRGFQKIYLLIWGFVYLISSFFFYYESYHSEIVFNFSGHYWDFAADRSSKLYGLCVISAVFLIMVLGMWRAVLNRGTERWAVLFMGIFISCTFMIPGVFNFLSRDGLIDRGTYQISQNLSTITGTFIASIIYINTTKDRSTFMSKIIISTLATLLILVQGFSYLTLQDQERSFDAILRSDTILAIQTGTHSSDLKYMVTYSDHNRTVSQGFPEAGVQLPISFTEVQREFYNTLVYEKIRRLGRENFKHDLDIILSTTDSTFAGYAFAIRNFINTLPADEADPAARLCAYMDGIERRTLFTMNKIRQLPDSGFASHLENFLPTARITVFNDALSNHLKQSKSTNAQLKHEVLEYLAPFRKAGTRIYRKDPWEKNHFVSVMQADTQNNTVIEAGYPYLNYRKYVHDTSKMYIYLLIIMVVVIVAGFPFFFWGSLVQPVRNLLSGLKEIQGGNLKVQIPVRVEDEFGYMARNFNMMADKIRAATENLEDTVMARTEALEAAMEEMAAMNRQLIETKEALWGEMQLAKKIQTVLLPRNSVLPGYDIAVSLEPVEDVGGDYYDIISVAGHEWIVIGDVSGHGVTSGIVMMMVQTAIHTVLKGYPDTPPPELLSIINRTIYDNIQLMDVQKHMTIVVMTLEPDGVFNFSGLHEDILIWRRATGRVEKIETNGMWIGIEPEISGMLSVNRLKMDVGDCMVLFTDGITESRMNGDFFGDDRLVSIVETAGRLSVTEIHAHVMQALEPYLKTDDITLLVIKRNQ
ncbi:MAG: SpoIIE family protein phosphatase [Desulfamplus sp.]|nr:SpoIIE family protein phosphatase [Desulfamplus sp.]